jgi:hypothetical protein
MILTPREFREVWQQVPDQYIWRNKLTGEFISINGTTDLAWYVVKRTVPTKVTKDSIGSVSTVVISPYFMLSSRPVGYVATQNNAYIRDHMNWQPGTFEDALNYAFKYMKKIPIKRR